MLKITQCFIDIHHDKKHIVSVELRVAQIIVSSLHGANIVIIEQFLLQSFALMAILKDCYSTKLCFGEMPYARNTYHDQQDFI